MAEKKDWFTTVADVDFKKGLEPTSPFLITVPEPPESQTPPADGDTTSSPGSSSSDSTK
jgi:hypothetical protein